MMSYILIYRQTSLTFCLMNGERQGSDKMDLFKLKFSIMASILVLIRAYIFLLVVHRPCAPESYIIAISHHENKGPYHGRLVCGTF